MTASPQGSFDEVAQRIVGQRFTVEEVATRVRQIHETTCRQSARITTGNFRQVADCDLELLFDLYDAHFFAGDLRRLISAGGAPVIFKFSARLTRSGGLTKRFAPRGRVGGLPAPAVRFEIVLSSTLLFQTFSDVDRVVRVNGLVCADRLEATQRIFEHELIHLAEMLIWTQSSCDAQRFKDLVWNLFAHTQTKHDLITQQERARTQFDVRVGDRVAFLFEGRRRVGIVNRITRRATVLVEDPAGEAFSDGKRYVKFYIPLPMLEKGDEGMRS